MIAREWLTAPAVCLLCRLYLFLEMHYPSGGAAGLSRLVRLLRLTKVLLQDRLRRKQQRVSGNKAHLAARLLWASIDRAESRSEERRKKAGAETKKERRRDRRRAQQLAAAAAAADDDAMSADTLSDESFMEPSQASASAASRSENDWQAVARQATTPVSGRRSNSGDAKEEALEHSFSRMGLEDRCNHSAPASMFASSGAGRNSFSALSTAAARGSTSISIPMLISRSPAQSGGSSHPHSERLFVYRDVPMEAGLFRGSASLRYAESLGEVFAGVTKPHCGGCCRSLVSLFRGLSTPNESGARSQTLNDMASQRNTAQLTSPSGQQTHQRQVGGDTGKDVAASAVSEISPLLASNKGSHMPSQPRQAKPFPEAAPASGSAPTTQHVGHEVQPSPGGKSRRSSSFAFAQWDAHSAFGTPNPVDEAATRTYQTVTRTTHINKIVHQIKRPGSGADPKVLKCVNKPFPFHGTGPGDWGCMWPSHSLRELDLLAAAASVFRVWVWAGYGKTPHDRAEFAKHAAAHGGQCGCVFPKPPWDLDDGTRAKATRKVPAPLGGTASPMLERGEAADASMSTAASSAQKLVRARKRTFEFAAVTLASSSSSSSPASDAGRVLARPAQLSSDWIVISNAQLRDAFGISQAKSAQLHYAESPAARNASAQAGQANQASPPGGRAGVVQRTSPGDSVPASSLHSDVLAVSHGLEAASATDPLEPCEEVTGVQLFPGCLVSTRHGNYHSDDSSGASITLHAAHRMCSSAKDDSSGARQCTAQTGADLQAAACCPRLG